MTKKRSLAFPGVVIALALTIAGCGGQPFPEASSPTSTRVGIKPASAHAQLLAAVKQTSAAKTAHFAVDVSMTGLGGEGDVQVSGSGAMDLVHKRFSMTMSAHGAATGAMSAEVRVIGSTEYLNAGRGWTRQSVSAAGTYTPVPTSYLEYLTSLGGTVTVKGREKVRGEETTRYSAIIDFSRAAQRVWRSGSDPALVKPLLDAFGLTKIPVTAWVDDAGRLRKMTLTMDMSALANKAGAPAGFKPIMEITLEMYDFGVPVSVEVPTGAVESSEPPADATTAHDVQSDLRNALTAEKTFYVDNMAYTTDVSTLKEIEPSLDWGGKLKVVVGNTAGTPDAVVCVSETANGVTYALADVASGFAAGTYYGAAQCPARVDEATVAAFGSSW